MARYPLNLPADLKKEAEKLAAAQGVSLNQFIMWAVAEKVGEMRSGLDDLNYPGITYRRGAGGMPTPYLRGTGVRVQTLILSEQFWGLSPEEIAADYGLPLSQVQEARAFYDAHRVEIDAAIEAERSLEPTGE